MRRASLLVAGINHRSAPLDLLERVAIPDDDLSKALHALMTYDAIEEGVVLSTCNRTEVYAVATKFHAGAQDLRNFLAEFCHVAVEDLADRFYTYHDETAVRHLFRVAAGIDSMIVGESEILGQVRRAYQVARSEGAVAGYLPAVFDRALHVGKRVRNETAIGRNPLSVSSAAVELAKRAVAPGGDHPLRGRSVAIVGAGKMGKLAAEALAEAGATEVVVVNRSRERAEAVARTFGADIEPLEALPEVLARVDIVLSSTTASEPVITLETARAGLARRDRESPLLIVDIAVPRDVDPAVGDLPGVVLRDIDDLKSVTEARLDTRIDEVAAAEDLVDREVQRLATDEAADAQGPTISALLERAENVRARELAAFEGRLARLSPEELSAVEHLTKRIVAKLMHVPIAGMKELSPGEVAVRSALLRELFELEDGDD